LLFFLKAQVTPDELLQAHTDLKVMEMLAAVDEHVEALLDAVQVKARQHVDLVFPSNWDIRKAMKADLPGWMPRPQISVKGVRTMIRNPEYFRILLRQDSIRPRQGRNEESTYRACCIYIARNRNT
jgi:hypothetical protein